jgi:hypothetical protein
MELNRVENQAENVKMAPFLTDFFPRRSPRSVQNSVIALATPIPDKGANMYQPEHHCTRFKAEIEALNSWAQPML